MTPWPPAAQMEISAAARSPSRRAAWPASATIRPPVAANGWPAASEEPLTLSFDAVDRAQRGVEAEALLAEHRVLPRLQRGEHLRGERLVDLVEVEVLQRQAVAREHPRHGVRRSHQQALAAVHVVDGGGLVRRRGRPAARGRARRPTPPRPAAPRRRRR